MEGDSEANQVDSDGIAKPHSAYQYFMKFNNASVRDSIVREGRDPTPGAIMSAASAKWKALSVEERAKFDEMAKKDRERYEEECQRRDEEALRRQEERRKANELTETSTRMRNSTMANSDASTVRQDNKRKREVSEKEREKTDARKQAKQAEVDTINSQLGVVHEDKARQAEARLKYLLSQSDIFSHFGNVKDQAASLAASKNATSSTTAKGRHRGGNNAAENDLDEDEKAMAKEIGDDDDENEDVSNEDFVLRQQPSIITGCKMRDYQLEGLNWMIRLQKNGINGILADEMGLGKTLQSISILAYMYEFSHIPGPHLVMVPKSTLSNWCNEFSRFCPSFRILRFHGSREERHEIVVNHLKPAAKAEERDWDVCITTYEIVNLEKAPLTKIAWRYLIIDEAHRLKNEASQFSTTVRLLTTQHRLLLTGTPLQNNLHELWALLNFLLPDVFASSEQFDEWFNLDISDTEMKQRIISQLHKLLRPFMLRRLKNDVEKSLPAKTETILFTGLSKIQKDLYRNILLRDIDAINSNSNSNQSRTAILNIVMQLRKCCNHPYLFPGVEDRSLDPLGSHLVDNCGKMVLLEKLLAKMKIRGHRVLIFSQMTRMLDILEDFLVARGYTYCRIDGNTTYEEREDRIFDFNREDSDKFIFILSTRAGGLGINLQTADTVILYDSDWNPQADLQAQDRAHRIGQKKPVQVFRLVTDDTVEVKVVERAQQKLKLDAMVVQQGRLQDKDKKMSKSELLETLKFGADKIFRSKDSEITDADIDLILEEGRKRTEAMNEKLQAAEKGDIYDFRLDGGMSTQIFEGKDYSDKSNRADPNNANGFDPFGLGGDSGGFFFLDTGKRERKPVQPTMITTQHDGDNEKTKIQKLPRHLRLNKMEDWQFFAKARLLELQAEETRLFEQMIEKNEIPTSNNTSFLSKLIVLPDELHQEKLRLIEEGFGDWTKVHFTNFVRASAKYGRKDIEKIAKDVGKPIDETRRYAEAFWTRGPVDLPQNDWDRNLKQIEKGEKRLEEISRLTEATAKLIAMFEDPWEELTFRNVGAVNRIFTAVEDRFLLCLTHLHGYGSWDQVRNSIRRCERFRFDFYLQSCSAETLGKRCELLMRSAERELHEIERKRQQAALPSAATAAAASNNNANDAEALQERALEITKKITEETRKLAAIRSQIQKTKNMSTSTPADKKKEKEKEKENAAGESNGISSSDSNGNNATSDSNKEEKEKEKRSAIAGMPRGTVIPVPESLYPEMCRIVMDGRQDGVPKIIEKFCEKYTIFSKRQVELKLTELAVKEKRGSDNRAMWYIRSDYQHFQYKPSDPEQIKRDLDLAVNPQIGLEVNQVKEDAVTSSSSAPVATVKTPKKEKSAEGSGNSEKKKTPGTAGAKRKASEITSPTTLATPSDAQNSSSSAPEPKKHKRAFAFFVKDMRSEAEKKLAGTADEKNQEKLKSLLEDMWIKVDAVTKKIYEKKEEEDKKRFERELAEWKKANPSAEPSSSTTPSAKKAKVNKD